MQKQLFFILFSIVMVLSIGFMYADDVIVEGVIIAKFTPEQIAQLPFGFDETANMLGVERVGHTYSMVVPVLGAILVDRNGQEILPNRENSFSNVEIVHRTMDRAEKESIWTNEPIVGLVEYPQLKTLSGYMTFYEVNTRDGKRILRLNQDFGGGMSCCSSENTMPNIRSEVMTREDSHDDMRCLDYNGTFSDGINYPKSDWRAYRNFINSDCFQAMLKGHCFLDHKNGGCYNNHGGKICSELIGCPTHYHKH